MSAQLSAFWRFRQWQAEVSLRMKYAASARKFVLPVLLNVKNMHTWSIAKNVQKPVANVQRNAAI
jgi:hypothetical protein